MAELAPMLPKLVKIESQPIGIHYCLPASLIIAFFSSCFSDNAKFELLCFQALFCQSCSFLYYQLVLYL